MEELHDFTLSDVAKEERSKITKGLGLFCPKSDNFGFGRQIKVYYIKINSKLFYYGITAY